MNTARDPEPADADADEPSAPTVLVVEDDILVRAVAAENLRDCGYKVVEAGSADDAVRLVNAGIGVDLVFSDVNMPGSMDGFGLALWLREHRPGTRILLTSGIPRSPQEMQAMQSFGPMLTKPYRLDQLAQRVSEMLVR